jgi:hypothetical protein
MSTVIFKEVQTFRSNLLWSLLTLLPFTGLFAILLYQLVTGKGIGDHPPPNAALVFLLIAVGLPAIITVFTIKLTTIITDEKIRYGWNFPTSELNEIDISEVKEVAVIRYRFVGYGYKLTRLYGTVYNVNGEMGLQILKKNGERILLGTHHEKELREIAGKIKALTG